MFTRKDLSDNSTFQMYLSDAVISLLILCFLIYFAKRFKQPFLFQTFPADRAEIFKNIQTLTETQMRRTMSSPFRTPTIFSSNQQVPTQLYRRPSKNDRDGSKKPRASKPKVKSGCITCKTRRVKCDETKPECVRCQKFGRKCDGYTPEPAPKSTIAQPIQPRVSNQNISGSEYCVLDSLNETFYFQFFCDTVAYELPGYFDSMFWTNIVFQEGVGVIPIRYAIIAIAALRKSLDVTPNNHFTSFEKEENISNPRQLAVTYYIKAIHALKDHISESDGPQMRTALIACILFACFETFQGNYTSSVEQLNEGLKLLQNHEHRKDGITSHAFIGARATSLDHPQSFIDNFSIQDHLPSQYNEGFHEPNTSSGVAQDSLYIHGALPEIVVDDESEPTHNAQNYPTDAINPVTYGMRANSEGHDQDFWDFPMPIGLNEYVSDAQVGDEFGALQEETQVHLSKFQPPRPRKLSTISVQLAPNSSSQSPTSTGPQSVNPSPRSTPAIGSHSAASSITTSTPPISTQESPIEDILIQVFVRLQGTGYASFFGNALNAESLNLETGIQKLCRQPIPLQFPSFELAHQCWDFLWYRIQHFCCQAQFNRIHGHGANFSPSMIPDTYSTFMMELVNFRHAFQPYLQAAIDPNGNISNATALVISMYHKVALVTLSAVTSDSELMYDSFTPAFRNIVRTASLLISAYPSLNLPRNPRLSFDIGIIIPLYTVAIKCRDPNLRIEAINLLANNPRTEGMWNSLICARIGKYVMELEEEGRNMRGFGSFNLSGGSSISVEAPLRSPNTHDRSMEHVYNYSSPSQMHGFDIYHDTFSQLEDSNGDKNSYPINHERSRSDATLNRSAAQATRLRYNSSAGLMSIDSENAIYATATSNHNRLSPQPPSTSYDSFTSTETDPTMLDPTFAAVANAKIQHTTPSPSSWNQPILEKHRVRIVVLEWHVPERFVKVVCERAILNIHGSRDVREKIIRW